MKETDSPLGLRASGYAHTLYRRVVREPFAPQNLRAAIAALLAPAHPPIQTMPGLADARLAVAVGDT